MIFDLHNGNFNIPITYNYEKHTPSPSREESLKSSPSTTVVFYQKIVYKAAITEVIMSIPTTKPGDILNMLLSTSNPLAGTPFLVSYSLIKNIPIRQIRNTNPIRSINGIS